MSREMRGGPTMMDNMGKPDGLRWGFWRIAGWSLAAIILLTPLVAMQFTTDVRWGPLDFAIVAVLLTGVGLTFEVAARKTRDTAYRVAAGTALLASLLLIWINLAVGIIGDEGNPANLMYAGVLAVAFIGAVLSNFHPRGLSRTMVATAGAQALAGGIALAFRWGADGPIWPRDIVGVTVMFVALWLLSAAIFGRAKRI